MIPVFIFSLLCSFSVFAADVQNLFPAFHQCLLMGRNTQHINREGYFVAQAHDPRYKNFSRFYEKTKAGQRVMYIDAGHKRRLFQALTNGQQPIRTVRRKSC